MIERVQELLNEAMALSPEDRADVAAELLVSLEEPSDTDQASVQSAWAKEIESRARRVTESETSDETWESVRSRIANSLSNR
jgi:hypothetical protein